MYAYYPQRTFFMHAPRIFQHLLSFLRSCLILRTTSPTCACCSRCNSARVPRSAFAFRPSNVRIPQQSFTFFYSHLPFSPSHRSLIIPLTAYVLQSFLVDSIALLTVSSHFELRNLPALDDAVHIFIPIFIVPIQGNRTVGVSFGV